MSFESAWVVRWVAGAARSSAEWTSVVWFLGCFGIGMAGSLWRLVWGPR